MKRYVSQGSDLSHHYALNDAEYTGRPPRDALSTEMAVENAKATIRALVSEDRRVDRRRALPELAPQEEIGAQDSTGATTGKTDKPGLSWTRRLRRFRPTPRHVAWVFAFGLVLWQPWAVLLVLFLAFWAVVIGYAVMGPERMRDLWGRATARLSPTLGKISLRRAPDPDPFSDLPDPFDRLGSGPH